MNTTPDLGLERTEDIQGPRAPYGKSPSVRPALIVLACAVVLTFGGFAVALVGSGSSSPPTVSGLATPVPGVNLAAVAAAEVLQRITSAGTPPSNVLGALVVPNGARIVGTTAQDAGVDQYDRSIYFQLQTSSVELLKFYRVELKRAHWSLYGEYPVSATGKEILARISGSDGYEWEVGVVVTPVNPSISPSLAGDGQTSATMGLRIRLFQIPDEGS
jgi:hypothetical protein